jgi:COP9 signalosome complex subunit 5
VEIGAFRTYPEGYTPPDATPSEYQPIPLNKIEDFGVHADMYYTLDLSIFKTSLDSQIIKLLWNKYWANTLSASPLLSNDGFIGGQLEDLGVNLSLEFLSSMVSASLQHNDVCLIFLLVDERV